MALLSQSLNESLCDLVNKEVSVVIKMAFKIGIYQKWES